MSYDGFISYSHAADDELAPRLQAGLQRFAKPWWQRRALRIFRDESSLAANPHLWDSITEALDTSGWFVLLLSPDAAGSEWVNQEVAYWLEHREADRIIPVVTTGEFGWDGSDVTGDCVPEALRGVFESEPRWVDARELGDPESLDLKNPEFAAVVADLAAPLRGVPKDELASEEVRQHKRTVRTAWSAGVVVLVLAVAAAGFGIQSSSNAAEADRQADIAAANTAEAEASAAAARTQAERADQTARRLIGFVLEREGDGTATVERPTEATPRSLGSVFACNPSNGTEFVQDDTLLVIADWCSDIAVYDLSTFDEVQVFRRGQGGALLDLAISGDRYATVGYDGNVRVWDTNLGKVILEVSFGVPLEFLDSVEFIDHDHLLVGFDDGSTIVLTLDVEELKSIASSRLTRGFTQQECTQYDIEPCPTLENLRG